jgi:DDE superfamily endonuclease
MKLHPSPEWEILLDPFRDLFTKPGYRYFCAFVLAFAHLDRHLHVTAVILSGLVDGRHFTSVYRFLRAGLWDVAAVRRRVWEVCQERAAVVGPRIFFVVDDTVCVKCGKCLAWLGWHHDPMNRQHPKQISHGHCWVCLALLVEQIPGHWVALFLGCALYVQQAVCGRRRGFVTKLTLAAQLASDLFVPAGSVMVIVADGAYARREFVQALRAEARHLVSRLRRDTGFYDLPPVRKKGQKGAPRKCGKHHAAQEWARTRQRWHAVTMMLYGKTAHLKMKSRVVIQPTFGVKIRLVAVKWGRRPLVFLFSTDTQMTAEEIIRVYCARFSIETGFKDSKQLFGFSTYRVRSEQAIERIVHLCLWAQTLLRLRCWKERVVPIGGDWRKSLGYLTLGQQKQLSAARCGILEVSHPGTERAEKGDGLPMAA